MIFDQICRFLLIRPQNSQTTLLPLRPFNHFTTGILFFGSLPSSIRSSISDNCCFGWITPANISSISQIQIEIKDKKQKRYKTGPWAAALQFFFRFFFCSFEVSANLEIGWSTSQQQRGPSLGFGSRGGTMGSDPWNDDGPNGSWINWWTRTNTARLLTSKADGHHQSLNYGHIHCINSAVTLCGSWNKQCSPRIFWGDIPFEKHILPGWNHQLETTRLGIRCNVNMVDMLRLTRFDL